MVRDAPGRGAPSSTQNSSATIKQGIHVFKNERGHTHTYIFIKFKSNKTQKSHFSGNIQNEVDFGSHGGVFSISRSDITHGSREEVLTDGQTRGLTVGRSSLIHLTLALNPTTFVELQIALPKPRCRQDQPMPPAETQSQPRPLGATGGDPGALSSASSHGSTGITAWPPARWSHPLAAQVDVGRHDDTHHAIPCTR